MGFLCLYAGLHAFIYAAAFPFFGNVDENAHFDTIVKYSEGRLPRSLEPFSDTLVRDAALYGSSFYAATNNVGERMPPPWTWPATQQTAWIAAQPPINHGTNFECSQPPLYYSYGGTGWRLSGALGLDEAQRLYLVRFLNIPIVMLMVWVGWLVAREVFPDRIFCRAAVTGLLAVMPQSAFYSIQSDAPLPLLFGLAFLGLLKFWRNEQPTPALGAVTGLALAAAFLTKMTCAFPVAIFVVVLGLLTWRHWKSGRLGQSAGSFLALGLCAGLPAVSWMIWSKVHFHDLTGSQARAEFWGWTRKPWPELWQHPIFTPHGTAKFLDHFVPSFWQGELVWHLHSIPPRAVDLAYTIVTLGLLAVVLATLLRRPSALPAVQREFLWMAFAFFAAATAFLVWMSIAYDFHDCPNPSRAMPYMVSGRLALPALIPFMVLIAGGLELVMTRLSSLAKFIALGALLCLIPAVEAAANARAFADPYNWFHI